jgi:hypothetical protein
MLDVVLAYTAFSMLRHSISTLVSSELLSKRILNLVKDFFCIYWDDHVIFILPSVYMSYYIYWLAYVEPSWHPWNETALVMVYDFFFFFVVLGFELRAYTLSHSTSPLLGWVFSERVLGTVCPGWLQNMLFLISASWVVRITGMSHWCMACCMIFLMFYWIQFAENFCIY